jgi:hypothetical protein
MKSVGRSHLGKLLVEMTHEVASGSIQDGPERHDSRLGPRCQDSPGESDDLVPGGHVSESSATAAQHHQVGVSADAQEVRRRERLISLVDSVSSSSNVWFNSVMAVVLRLLKLADTGRGGTALAVSADLFLRVRHGRKRFP